MEQIKMASQITAILLAMLFFSSCSGILLLHQMDQGQPMTAEQLKTYKDMQMDVYSCVEIAGPPPAGHVVNIIMPNNSKPAPRFGDGCRIIQ